MPGIEYDQLIRLVQLADRVSVNLKGSTQERLNALAPKKGFQREWLSMVQLAEEIRRTHPYEKLAGTVTQFVVGAVGGTDRELLSLGHRFYRQYGLTRAYYSGFGPVIQTPFENLPATDPLCEHRLYQASFLLRDYGWKVEDLAFLSDGKLGLVLDPKRAWVERHLRKAPIEAMTASRQHYYADQVSLQWVLMPFFARVAFVSQPSPTCVNSISAPPNRLLLIFCWMVIDRLSK